MRARHRIVIVVAALLITGCTIAPKVTEPSKTSPWAQANILGYDSTGIFVGADWPRVYHGLLAAYGSKLPINEQVPSDDMTGIVKIGSRLHVTFATNKRMTDLYYFQHPGP